MPLPFATSNLFPSGVTRTEVGYQPTGIKPSERLFPGVLTSKTATALLSAFATKRVFSSGVKARLLGVDPGGAFGYKAAQIVSSDLPLSASKTETVLRLALATNKNFPERVRAISQGCSSVDHLATTVFEVRSMTATADCAHKLTYKRWRFSSRRQA